MPAEQFPAMEKTFRVRRTLDLLILFVLSAAVYFLAATFDILETIVVLAAKHETWELDEFITLLVFLAFALIVFVGRRWQEDIVLKKSLVERNEQLQAAMEEIKQLRGILPICAACKRIRDDSGYWHRVETYVEAHSDASFTHSICPACSKKLYPDLFADE